jgi:hypothetical protein
MSTFDLSAFAPARPAAPVHLGDMRREWADLMDQLLVQGKIIPKVDDKKLTDEEKRHQITKWESVTVSFPCYRGREFDRLVDRLAL